MRIAATSNRSRAWRSRWAAIGAAVAVTLGGGGLFVASAATSASSTFFATTPARGLDTRSDVGLPGPFVPGVSQKLKVTGPIPIQPATGSAVTQQVVPAGATAVVLNVTVVRPGAPGFLSIRPGDASGTPSVSNINYGAGGPNIANGVTVALPTTGSQAGFIDIYVSSTVGEVLIDIAGYYLAATGGGTDPSVIQDLQDRISDVETEIDDRIGTGANAVMMQGFEVQMSFGSTQTIAENGDLTLSLRCREDDNSPDQAFTATNRNNMQFRAFSTGQYMTTYVDNTDLYENEGVTIARALGSSTPDTMVQTTFVTRDGVRTAAAMTGADGSQISVDGDSVQVMFNVDDPAVTGGGTVDCYARGIVMMLPPR